MTKRGRMRANMARRVFDCTDPVGLRALLM